jgi:trans-2,3-dihydro-3-hydroxyanthranilate isomerase
VKKECIFVDAFTDTPYAGNQLAVFPDGRGLSTAQMLRLAQEINYSETTYIFDATRPEADFAVRIFTPARELPFAGHPTLGTAYSIMEIFDIWSEKRDILKLETKVGIIPLRKEKGMLWMTQIEPEFFKRYTDSKEIAALFDLEAGDIAGDLPVEEVSTGNKILIVPITTLNAIERAQGNVMRMKDFFKKDLIGPYLFSLETTEPSAKIHTRFFAPHLGILEDPATGSAAGPLVGYLLKHRVFGDEFEVANEQGVEMGRRSTIMMRGNRSSANYIVEIGGKCVYVGRGEFEI